MNKRPSDPPYVTPPDHVTPPDLLPDYPHETTELLTKRQAAELLRSTPRTVERYAREGRLHPQHRRGKYGQEALYPRDELDAIRAEQDAPVKVTPPLAPERGAPSTALAPRDLSGLFAAIVQEARAQSGEGARVTPREDGLPPSELAAMATVSLRSAARLSGIPIAQLRSAAREGRLPSAKIGRGTRVRPSDVLQFAARLFDRPDNTR